MPLDTSLIKTDLPAIITALSEKGPRFVKHGPDRAAQLQEVAGALDRIAGEVEREAQQMQRVAEMIAEAATA